MSGVLSVGIPGTLKEPLTTLVMNDLREALKRIKSIKFHPDRVAIELIAGNVSVKGSIMILGVVVEGKNAGFPYAGRFELTTEYKERFVDFDEETNAIVIPIPGVTKLTFSNGRKSYSFSKPKSGR